MNIKERELILEDNSMGTIKDKKERKKKVSRKLIIETGKEEKINIDINTIIAETRKELFGEEN